MSGLRLSTIPEPFTNVAEVAVVYGLPGPTTVRLPSVPVGEGGYCLAEYMTEGTAEYDTEGE